MRTTLDLDQKLMEELVQASRCTTKTEAIEVAAREYLRQLQAEKMISHFGKIKIEPVYKALRKRDRDEAKRFAREGLFP